MHSVHEEMRLCASQPGPAEEQRPIIH
jgi:hypothetical protein